MTVVTDLQYFARREQEELVLAMAASNPIIADLHYEFASQYHVKLKAPEYQDAANGARSTSN